MKSLTKFYILLSVMLSLAACKSEDIVYPDNTEDYPRIISTWPQKTSNGLPGQFNVILGEAFTQELIYTPTSVASCKWYLDGELITEGSSFSFTPSELGRHYIKVIVDTGEKQSFREAYLSVSNP